MRLRTPARSVRALAAAQMLPAALILAFTALAPAQPSALDQPSAHRPAMTNHQTPVSARLTGDSSTTRVGKAKARAVAADAAASQARAQVDAELERYQDASAQVSTGLQALNAAYAAGAAAETDAAEAAAQRRRAAATRSRQVWAVYASGGPAGLTASVLGATSADDVLWRVSTADRVLASLLTVARHQVTTRAEQAERTQRRAVEAEAATDAQAQALLALQRRADRAASALDQAKATLNRLDARARQARAAREAAEQIAAAQAAAEAAARAAMGEMTALAIPAEYQSAYQSAALTCPGMSWTLLAGVGQIETGHGRNSRPSSAGAIGPMQFMPATFAAYAVDGDGDGVLDAWDPQDAIFSAAHYLCVSGGRSGAVVGSAAWKNAALLAYNHAQWYVDLVLAAEAAIVAREAAIAQP